MAEKWRRIIMNCPNCYSPVADGARFCTKCGAKLPTVAPNQAQYAPQPPVNAPYNAQQPVQNHYGFPNPAAPQYYSGQVPYVGQQPASMPSKWSGGVIALGVIGFVLALASFVAQLILSSEYHFNFDHDAESYIFMLGMPLLAMLMFVIPTKKVAILTAIPFAAVIVRYLIDVIPNLEHMETMPIVYYAAITASLIVYVIGTLLGRKSQYWIAVLFFLLAVPVAVWLIVHNTIEYVDYFEDTPITVYLLSLLGFVVGDLMFAISRTAALFSLANSANKLRR